MPASNHASVVHNALKRNSVEVTFIAADPPRMSNLAIWTDNPTTSTAYKHLDRSLEGYKRKTIQVLDKENDGSLRTCSTEAALIPISEALDTLCSVDTNAEQYSASTKAWAIAAQTTLALLSLGKIYPALTPAGIDVWSLGPLDDHEREFQKKMAAALPLKSYTIQELPGIKKKHVRSADISLLTFQESIADVFLRTAAAEKISGHKAFASREATIIDHKAAVQYFNQQDEDSIPHVVLKIQPDTNQDGTEIFQGILTLQSRSNPEATIPTATFWNGDHANKKRYEQTKAFIHKVLQATSRAWPPLKKLAQQQNPDTIIFTEGELDELFSTAVTQRLGAAGLGILLPDERFHGITITPVLTQLPTPGASSKLSLSSLIELQWKGSIDGEQISESELNELAESKRSIIRVKGKWVKVSQDLKKTVTSKKTIDTSSAIAASLGSKLSFEGKSYDVEVSGTLASLQERLKNKESKFSQEEPEELQAELRPYQKRGLAWLSEMDELGLGGILADDMGLGKTIQVLSMHLFRQENNPAPSLVICPASVIGNWEREAKKFIPTIPVHRYHGTHRSLQEVSQNDIVLTTYGIVRRDNEELNKIKWGLLIADEAHALKNPFSRTARSLRMVESETRLALTGTPIQNQLLDLWALLDWTTPGLLGSLTTFKRDIASPIERVSDEETAERLRSIVKPFLLRRQKSDPEIAPELPPKTETDEFVPLTAEQASLYKAIAAETMSEIESSEGINRKGLILKLLTQLKQVCNHPVQILNDAEDEAGIESRSGKLTALLGLLSTIKHSGEFTLIFTQYVAMGDILTKHLNHLGYKTIFLHGSLPVESRDKLVDQFQAGEADVFVISLRAGGLGLNLTKASHVVHYDRWWNPAIEDQASDRAWRLGQKNPVQIHRLICEGTIEDKIASLLNEKRMLADSIVGSGESWISELDNDQLAELVSLSEEAVID